MVALNYSALTASKWHRCDNARRPDDAPYFPYVHQYCESCGDGGEAPADGLRLSTDQLVLPDAAAQRRRCRFIGTTVFGSMVPGIVFVPVLFTAFKFPAQ
jgi:hypothetical protein